MGYRLFLVILGVIHKNIVMKLNEMDKQTLSQRGTSVEKIESQLRMLRSGFPYLHVLCAATPGNGILQLTDEERKHYERIWKDYLADGARVIKMVPASGAASRMFKDLFAFAAESSDAPDTDFIREFCERIHCFPFFDRLDAKCEELYGKSIDGLFDEGRRRDVVKALVSDKGLAYGAMPKALLPFHRHGQDTRTALEEHLAEGAQYAKGTDNIVHVHFTVSDEHRQAVENLLKTSVPDMEKVYGVRYDVSLSVQKPSTDTVALAPDGELYREDGSLFFRPGGHGALIENLAEIDGDVIFIKNIDNVVPDSKRDSTIEYKQVLGGLLVETARKIRHYAGELHTSLPSRPELDEMLGFLRERLCISTDKAARMDDLELADFLMCKLERPIRVCGMVRNEGEPGGGPYIVYDNEGTSAPQILESTQINPKAPDSPRLLKDATHFNPVDLAVITTDSSGARFDLKDFVDQSTGFISSKSHKGTEIKALELPGLWNGAMSDWNTIFVEVPADTFNPVKTVNDLLRPAHQE